MPIKEEVLAEAMKVAARLVKLQPQTLEVILLLEERSDAGFKTARDVLRTMGPGAAHRRAGDGPANANAASNRPYYEGLERLGSLIEKLIDGMRE